MKSQFNIMRQNRQVFINLVNGLTIEELNTIPEGFNNNIAWNFNHMVVTPQVLNYIKAGAALTIPEEQLKKYARGTKPEGFISQEEINYYKELAIKTVDQLEEDWNNNIFQSYESFTTVMGVTLATKEEALHYVVAHDYLHLGYALAQKRMIQTKK